MKFSISFALHARCIILHQVAVLIIKPVNKNKAAPVLLSLSLLLLLLVLFCCCSCCCCCGYRPRAAHGDNAMHERDASTNFNPEFFCRPIVRPLGSNETRLSAVGADLGAGSSSNYIRSALVSFGRSYLERALGAQREAKVGLVVGVCELFVLHCLCRGCARAAQRRRRRTSHTAASTALGARPQCEPRRAPIARHSSRALYMILQINSLRATAD